MYDSNVICCIDYVTNCTDFSGTVPIFNSKFRVPKRSFGTRKYTDFGNMYRILYRILSKGKKFKLKIKCEYWKFEMSSLKIFVYILIVVFVYVDSRSFHIYVFDS